MKRHTVHIQSATFPQRSLCGLRWPVRGGQPVSDTTPPVVRDDRGSANAASCLTCIAVWRKLRRAAR